MAERRLSPEALQILRGVWVTMAAVYGSERWSRSFGDSPEREPGSGELTVAGREWAATIDGLSRKQIRAGVSATRFSTSPWLPSAPEFRGRCLSIPSWARVMTAFTVAPAGANATESAFCRAVWARVDSYRYRQANNHDASRMLHDAYDAAADAVMRGEPLPEPPALLDTPDEGEPSPPASPETVERAMGTIRDAIGDWSKPEPEPEPEQIDEPE